MHGVQGGERSVMSYLAALLIFIVLSCLLSCWGRIILAKLNSDGPAVFSLAFGGCAFLLTGMICSMICGAFLLTAGTCITVTAVLTVLLSVLGFIVKKRVGVGALAGGHRIRKSEAVMIAVSAILVAAVVYLVLSFRFENTAAISKVHIATRVFESGRVHLSDPMMTFIGCIGYAVNIHPLKLIYVLSPALVTFYFLCWASVICSVVDGYKRFIAFCAVLLLNIFGYQSEKLIGVTMLVSWFSLAVFMIHGALGMAAVILIKYEAQYKRGPDEGDAEENEELSEEWDMKKHRIINARNLAIALGVLAAALAAAVFVLNSKINKLYDATLNLQADMNNRCSIYEFAPDGETEGYLVRGSDGTVSFVGGGSSENAEAAAEFIGKYAAGVKNWYVYGDDEGSSGAARTLMDSGSVNIEKIYVIDRKEITGQE